VAAKKVVVKTTEFMQPIDEKVTYHMAPVPNLHVKAALSEDKL